MRSLIVASCLLALAAAKPGYVGLGYNAIPVVGGVYSQYHAQDELGQYSYGYVGDTSAKQETRTLDGITRGGYSYLDAHGLVQSADYVSDPLNGFRVAATNLPVGPSALAPAVALAGAPLQVADSPDVAAAKLAHFQAHAEAISKLRKKRAVAYLAAPAAVVAAPGRSFAYSAVTGHGVHAVAVPLAAAPLVAAPLAAAVGSGQYHAQDALGQYSYGYANINSAKHESRAFDGTTHGGYSYVDAHGLVQSVDYHADALGFRAVGTNIPVGP